MKFKIKISKFLKLYKNEAGGEVGGDSMYWLIDEYLSTHHQCEITLPARTLDYAFYKMAKNIDRSKLAVDIFVAEPKFTKHCPTNLVKFEYRGFFLDADGMLESKKFLKLLKFAGVKKFTLDLDAVAEANAEYTTDAVE